MGKSLVITSGKGGTGKSTLCALLGRALAGAGKTVVLVDACTGLRSLDLMLGLQDRVVYDLSDAAVGTCRLRQALVKDRALEGRLALLPAAQGDGAKSVPPETLRALTTQLSGLYDWVLIDCPTGVGADFESAVHAAGRALIVTQDDPVSLRAAERALALLPQREEKPCLVLNRAPYVRGADARLRAKELSDRLGMELLGILPGDAGLPGQLTGGEAEAAAKRIARRLLGETVDIPPLGRPRRLFRGHGAPRDGRGEAW